MPALVETAPSDTLGLFESTLAAMIEVHEQMLVIARDHRAAIGRADGQMVQACIGQQAVLAARVAELDADRKRLSAALAPGTMQAPTTISSIAQNLPEPARSRIVALATRLRELLTSLQRENRIIRTATESLITHMDGLMQQVARALSHARLYSPRGRIDAATPIACGLDLTH